MQLAYQAFHLLFQCILIIISDILLTRLLGPLYFVGFVIMMFFIIINMFLGILADSFTMVGDIG